MTRMTSLRQGIEAFVSSTIAHLADLDAHVFETAFSLTQDLVDDDRVVDDDARRTAFLESSADATEKSLAIALEDANARVARYSQDATDSHDAMMTAFEENERLAEAVRLYEAAAPELARANDALRRDVLSTFNAMQTEFASAMRDTLARACATTTALEKEKTYQEKRNGALHARNRELYGKLQDVKGAIRVFARIRPASPGVDASDVVVEPGRCLDPAAEGVDVVCKPPGSNVAGAGRGEERRPASKRSEEKRVGFDAVFGPSSTQADVYEELSPLVRGVLEGYNCTIFAYGQTGSGKTHTMGGPEDAGGSGNLRDDADAGVNVRALRELFALAASKSASDGVECVVSVEMREIYNERVRDLLNPAEKEDSWDGVGSTNKSRLDRAPGDEIEEAVTRVDARDAAHVLRVMAEGTSRRASAGTKMNERSSRSHSVVTVYVSSADVAAGRVARGRLHLIDLAGSERVARSEATGDRLKEAQHINKSLSALGDVIAALLEKRAHVPYRNSQLTRLLSDSLGGNSKVVLLAHVSPESASLPETSSTLLFAQRCSQVELGKAKANASVAAGGGASDVALASLNRHKSRAADAEARAADAEERLRAMEMELERSRAATTAAEAKLAEARKTLKSAKGAALRDQVNANQAREPLSPVHRNASRASEEGSSMTPTTSKTPYSKRVPASVGKGTKSAAKSAAFSRAAMTASSTILASRRDSGVGTENAGHSNGGLWQ